MVAAVAVQRGGDDYNGNEDGTPPARGRVLDSSKSSTSEPRATAASSIAGSDAGAGARGRRALAEGSSLPAGGDGPEPPASPPLSPAGPQQPAGEGGGGGRGGTGGGGGGGGGQRAVSRVSCSPSGGGGGYETPASPPLSSAGSPPLPPTPERRAEKKNTRRGDKRQEKAAEEASSAAASVGAAEVSVGAREVSMGAAVASVGVAAEASVGAAYAAADANAEAEAEAVSESVNEYDHDDDDACPLLDLAQRLPDLFVQEVLARLTRIDRTMLGQVGRPWRAVVVASGGAYTRPPFSSTLHTCCTKAGWLQCVIDKSGSGLS
jgi:hypothetical protein